MSRFLESTECRVSGCTVVLLASALRQCKAAHTTATQRYYACVGGQSEVGQALATRHTSVDSFHYFLLSDRPCGRIAVIRVCFSGRAAVVSDIRRTRTVCGNAPPL